jgi:beta-galactosidase
VSYFRWRQAPFAQEQLHSGLLRPDSAPAPALAEAAQVAAELAEMPDVAADQAPVALVFDYVSAWAWETQPQGQDFDYFNLVFDAYRALRRAGLSVDILPPETEDFAGYRFVLIPGLMSLSTAVIGALEDSEALVLLGPRTNVRDPDFAIPVPLPPALPGLNVTLTLVESLPPGLSVPIEGGGTFVRWFEHLEGPEEGMMQTETGELAVASKGQLRYLAGWPDEGLWDRIVKDLCAEVGLEPEVLPDGLRVRDAGSRRFVFNYAAEAQTYKGTTLPPAGVAWMSK